MPSEPRFRSLRSLVFKRNQDSESSSGPLLSRRGLLGAAVGCGFCALGGFVAGRVTAGPSTVGRTRTVDQRRSVQPNGLFRVRTNEPVVALTFDDGPDPRCTPDVLSLLKDAEAVATFFLVGVNAAADPELVRKVLASGHSVGNHTYDHRELQLLTPANVRSEIDRGQRSLIRAGAPAPRLFRPPMGYRRSRCRAGPMPIASARCSGTRASNGSSWTPTSTMVWIDSSTRSARDRSSLLTTGAGLSEAAASRTREHEPLRRSRVCFAVWRPRVCVSSTFRHFLRPPGRADRATAPRGSSRQVWGICCSGSNESSELRPSEASPEVSAAASNQRQPTRSVARPRHSCVHSASDSISIRSSWP